MSGNEEMNARILGAAGRGRVARMVPEMPEANRLMNDRILAAAGRLPAEPPSSAIPEDADVFTREAMTLGVPADLIDVTRRLVDGNLAGAALTSALTKLIGERPGLISPGFAPPAALAGLEGGQRSPREPEPPADMNALIRAKARGASVRTRRHPNGVPDHPAT